jgi:hypothetical protein
VNLLVSANQPPRQIGKNGSLAFTSSRGGQGRDIIFNANAGDTIAAFASGGTFPSNNDLVMEFEDPAGNDLTGEVGAGQSGCLSQIVLPSTGTYTLDVIPQDSATGTVTFALSTTATCAAP